MKPQTLFYSVLAAATAAIVCTSALSGQAGLSPSEVWQALFRDGDGRAIVVDLRLLRTMAALCGGAATALAGCLMQTLFRNPLAGPYVLGISSGASLGASLFLCLPAAGALSGAVGSLGLGFSALAGAAVLMAAIAFTSRRTGDMLTVLIIGMMLSAGADAATQLVQYFSGSEGVKAYVLWTMGSFGSVTRLQLALLAGSLAAGTLLAAASAKGLNLMMLGPETARSLGADTARTRTSVYLSVTLLAGITTAFCGPVSFLGLVVPHICRDALRASDHRKVIPAVILAGAALCGACDLAARLLTIPVNVLTSLVGIPFVIRIILRQRRTEC